MDRTVTRGWLRESNIYDNFVNAVSETAEEQLGREEGDSNAEGEQRVDIEVLTNAAKTAFPPHILQTNVEAVLDGFYDWLEGRSEQLMFNLDLSEARKTFVDTVGSEALARAATLPACPAGQSVGEFDPLSASCLPVGMNIQTEVDRIKNELATSQDFLPDTQLSADDIKLDVDGQQKPLSEAFPDAPKWYGRISRLPWVLTGLAGLNILLILLLARPRKGALKIIAWFFGPVGVIFLLGGATGSIFARLEDGAVRFGDAENGIAENIAIPLLQEASRSFSAWNLIFGAIYVGMTILLTVIYLTGRPKEKHPTTQTTEPTPPIDDSPKQSSKDNL